MIDLRPRPSSPSVATPAGLILECHGRIRTFSELAARLAGATGLPRADLLETSERLHRYFTIALPFHVADEEESIEPRLLAREPALAALLADLRRQHTAIDGVLAELIAAWAAHQPGTTAAVVELGARMGAHLDVEERMIVPAIERLDAGETQALLAEIRARRA
jgi:hemerythrin HHE cation binding domain-containing protein